MVKEIPDNSVDLVITDPPYQFACGGMGGAFGIENRPYIKEYIDLCKNDAIGKVPLDGRKIKQRAGSKFISLGFSNEILDELCRVMKKINIYIWCSKDQLRQIIDYFDDKDCFIDLITWHKTNPIPTCNNTYLSDTEYCVFAREKGVKVYGTVYTKHKYYVTKANTEDKKKYGHPTIKPIQIIQNFVINSSQEGDTVLDCFMGSGTTGVACKNTNRNFIGIEIDDKYYEIAKRRLDEITLF